MTRAIYARFLLVPMMTIVLVFPNNAAGGSFHAYTSKKEMAKGNKEGWDAVVAVCKVVDEACAQAANVEVTTECGADAALFTKDSKKWTNLSFALVIASAAFTGVGAAATIAGSTTVPKVFSTLGGTTGLGAVTSSANANVTSDQAGLATINNEIMAWLTFLHTGKPDLSQAPTAKQIYQAAPGYIAACLATANASPKK